MLAAQEADTENDRHTQKVKPVIQAPRRHHIPLFEVKKHLSSTKQ